MHGSDSVRRICKLRLLAGANISKRLNANVIASGQSSSIVTPPLQLKLCRSKGSSKVRAGAG